MRRAPTGAAWRWLAVAVALLLGVGTAAAVPGDIRLERQGAAPEGAAPEGAAPEGTAPEGTAPEADDSAAIPPAIFSHWFHRIRYRCYVCHPKVFEMKAGANEITMDKMQQGESCGLCHNGAIAFRTDFQNCGRCHVAPQE